MDKARSFEYVRRLPSDTANEVAYKEAVYDHQTLLNEEWEVYAARKGFPESVLREEHVKWVTETWEQYQNRKRRQKELLAHYDSIGEHDIHKADAELASRTKKADRTVAHLMKFRDTISASKTPSHHHLYVDFDDYQRIIFCRERNVLGEEETIIRAKIAAWEDTEVLFNAYYTFSSELYALMQRLREEEEEMERQRIEEARRRAEEEERNREEQRRKDEERAEIRRREEAEAEKRLERKRREEERRAKARAERDRQRETGTAADPVPSDAQPEVIEKVAEPTLPDFSDAKQEPERKIQFSNLSGDNFVSLFNEVTRILSSAGDSSYVMNVRRNPCESHVICHNGAFLGEHHNDGESHLLGRKICTDKCISVSSPRLHSLFPTSVEDYLANHIEIISDVSSDDRCFLFDANGAKADEELALFPVNVAELSYSPYIVALSRRGADSISPDEVTEAGALVFSLLQQLASQMHKAHLSRLCQQCVEWIHISTGCGNVYISLCNDGADLLTYVAATASQRFLVGQRHSIQEEQSGNGVSFAAMSRASEAMGINVYSFVDVATPTQSPFPERKVRLLGDNNTGPLMVAPITGELDGKGVSLGVVFADRLGSKKAFSEVEEEITRAATQLLSDLMLGHVPPADGLRLKIEEGVSGEQSPIMFLKALWQKTLDDLRQITPNQLLELAKYNHPPDIIPVVVQSTLLVAIGCKPNKIEDWGEARKRVTKKLVDKMESFDPTDTSKRKRPFFIRSRKLLKGYTAKDVFEKGSYPTQCFFKWVFAAILLRKHAESKQKQVPENMFDLLDTDSFYSQSTDGGGSAEEVEDEDFEDTVEEAM